MANMSDAYGEYVIHANKKQTIKDVLTLMAYTLGDASYWTELSDLRCKPDVWVEPDRLVNDDYIIAEQEMPGKYKWQSNEMSFSGTGRWSYGSNVEMLMEWVRSCLFDCWDKFPDEAPKSLDELKRVYKRVIKEDFLIVCDYTEEESGCGFINIGVKDVLRWDASKAGVKVTPSGDKIANLYYGDYETWDEGTYKDWSIPNLREAGFDGEADAQEEYLAEQAKMAEVKEV